MNDAFKGGFSQPAPPRSSLCLRNRCLAFYGILKLMHRMLHLSPLHNIAPGEKNFIRERESPRERNFFRHLSFFLRQWLLFPFHQHATSLHLFSIHRSIALLRCRRKRKRQKQSWKLFLPLFSLFRGVREEFRVQFCENYNFDYKNKNLLSAVKSGELLDASARPNFVWSFADISS